MRPRHRAYVVFALLALSAAPAFAYTYGDTLTTIWKPLPNLPALARPGDTLEVWANAPSSAADWAASLGFGALSVPLALSGGGWQPAKNRWELSFAVPAGTAEEIYALVLTSDTTLPDTAMHAVKVLPAYKSDYYFAQISDTHLPEHAFSSGGQIDPADTTGMADFSAVIEDLNVINPEFILHTGDFVNEGELEEYLGMYEMGRGVTMLNRLRAPIFVVSGNHDIGGWQQTAPPDGTARKNWWRQLGWKFLENPPAGDPRHTQDFSFDYGPLHVIGLEGYINNGSYDHFQQNIWGAQSFTADQLAWLQSNIAAQPPGTHKLVFYHYDFGGTLGNGQPGPSFSQINPTALGLDGAIWGHNHGVADGNRTAQPFNLGLQSVIDRRAFRLFRVHNGVISPAPMHRSGGLASAPTDSLSLAWSGPNNGTRSALSVTVVNRFGEPWEYARLMFQLADHDSSFVATGGTIAQVLRQGGIASVAVNVPLAAGGTSVVSVQANAPLAGVPTQRPSGIALRRVEPNPFRASAGSRLTVHFALPTPQHARLEIMDVAGRLVTLLADGEQPAGERAVEWNGHRNDGSEAAAGVYIIRLTAGGLTQTRRFSLAR